MSASYMSSSRVLHLAIDVLEIHSKVVFHRIKIGSADPAGWAPGRGCLLIHGRFFVQVVDPAILCRYLPT